MTPSITKIGCERYVLNRLDNLEVATGDSRVVLVSRPLLDAVCRSVFVSVDTTACTAIAVLLGIIGLVEIEWSVWILLGHRTITIERDLETVAASPSVAPAWSGRPNVPTFTLKARRHNRKRSSSKSERLF